MKKSISSIIFFLGYLPFLLFLLNTPSNSSSNEEKTAKNSVAGGRLLLG